jgi:YD repeat-containing protein
MGIFTGSSKTVTTTQGNQTTSKDYDGNGKCTDIRHTDNPTGETHSHNVGHSIIGPFTGSKK